MGAGANNGNSERVEIRMTRELKARLNGLAKLGLYGGSLSEVVRQLVTAEMRRLTRDGEVKRWLEDQRLLAGDDE
jgi:Arc/MetJ-type ribon-helix-helix transcriptional regulator